MLIFHICSPYQRTLTVYFSYLYYNAFSLFCIGVFRDALIFELSDCLSKAKGKKSYGYLPPEIKNIVDEIIVELAKDERIKELYNLWYQQKEDVTRIYTDSIPPRKPLVQNEEFRPLKNAVINEILKMTDSIPTDMEEMYHRVKAENPVMAEELKQKLYGIYGENRQN